MQKNTKNQEYQNGTEGHVLGHHLKATLEIVGIVGPGGQFDPRWQGLGALIDIAMHRRADTEFVFVGVGHDADAKAANTVKKREALDLCEAVIDIRDVAEGYAGAILCGKQQNVLEIGAGIGLPFGAKANVSALGANGAAGQVDGPAANGLCHLIQSQTILAQGGL